ncbi:MAG TPA: TonB-dependent receptor [Candidatus Dojkabacteria bacterium]
MWPLLSQTTISGVITDKESGDSLPDVNIYIKDTNAGTVSGINGKFLMTVTKSPPFILVFSYVGYKSEEFQITENRVELDINLDKELIGSNQVIVTALRREEQLMEVPSSISVFNKDFINQTSILNNIGDLTLHSPGLSGFQISPTNQLFTIRGIGSDIYGIGAESSVGVFLDDFYVGRVLAPVFFLDLERVEIIKGPQSTLFGRNTSAGAISLNSNKPRNKKEGILKFGIGNEGQKSTDYVLNLPLSNNFMFRLAGKYNYRDGVRKVINLNDRQLNGINLFANRLSFLLRAQNNWLFQFSLEYQRSDTEGWDYYSINTNLGSSGNPFDREIELSTKNDEYFESILSRLEINKILSENIYLKFMTGYRSWETSFFTDGDATPLFILDFYQPLDSKNFTQEIRLVGNHERLNWLIGSSFYLEDINTNISLIYDDHKIIGGIPINENELGFDHPSFILCDEISDMLLGPCLSEVREDNHNQGEYYSYNFFSDIYYKIGENIRISSGLRFSVDNKNFKSNLPFAPGLSATIIGDNLIGPNTGGNYIRNSKIFTGLQPRVSIDYIVEKKFMVYANYSRGYKAGGFNDASAILYNEESSNAFEIGLKSSINSDKIKLNAALYYTDYNDLQVQTIGDVSGILVTDNAAEVESKGIEVEASLNFDSGISITGNSAIGKARYKNYFVGNDDFSGNTPSRSPDFSYSLIAHYEKSIDDFGDLKCRLDYGYQSKIFFSRENLEALSQDGYGILNANISFNHLLNSKIEITLYGYNLLNKEYLLQAEDPLDTGPSVLRSVPRLLGVKVAYHFF